LAECALPYSIYYAAVGYVDVAVAVEVAVSQGEFSRRTCLPKIVYNVPVININEGIIIDIA